MDIVIHCDGGSRGNPGPAACAFVALHNGVEIFSKGTFLGITTNNVAEYTAVLTAFEWIKTQSDITSIHFVLDSELVVKQMKGIYKIKSPLLLPLVQKIKAFERTLNVPVDYRHVLRNENTQADLLVNQTMDASA